MPRRQDQGDEDLVLTPDDCNVYENIQGTAWGANPGAAKAAATAKAKAIYNALKVNCPDDDCPFPKKDWSIGKPKLNTITLPFFDITITIGWSCDFEVIYGCFKQGEV